VQFIQAYVGEYLFPPVHTKWPYAWTGHSRHNPTKKSLQVEVSPASSYKVTQISGRINGEVLDVVLIDAVCLFN
jgi:hypothetical protein